MAVFGMTRTVLRNLFSRPATRLYPSRMKEAHRSERSRGRIAIDIGACIFCGACAKRCPTDAIVVTKAAREWTIDRLRCCTCNACVEVCPTKCLSMENRYTPPTATKDRDAFHLTSTS
jgi:ech hydrogenase subunit F